MNRTETLENSAYLLFIVQFIVSFTYPWWTPLFPVQLFYPLLLLPAAIGLVINILTLRRDRKKALIWCVTIYYAVFGGFVLWDYWK